MRDDTSMERRLDHYTAVLIDTLLRMSDQTRIRLSTRALLNLGLPIDVIERVLSKPEARRQYPAINNK